MLPGVHLKKQKKQTYYNYKHLIHSLRCLCSTDFLIKNTGQKLCEKLQINNFLNYINDFDVTKFSIITNYINIFEKVCNVYT